MANVKYPLSSSATAGFFQTLPIVPPQYTTSSAQQGDNSSGSETPQTDDVILTRILAQYLPQPIPALVDQHLHNLARTCVDPTTLRLCVDAEINVPTLHPMDTFGQANEVNALRTGEGWRGLKDIGIQAGSVALGYGLPAAYSSNATAGWNRRVHQFAANHLWAASAAVVTCPAAMTDGAAILLGKHLNDADGDQPGRQAVIVEARKRLISFDPVYAWTSGQWMTERTGGSDVSGTETAATRLNTDELKAEHKIYGSDQDQLGMPLGPWKIDGFKWFSSATDADVVVLLARTAKGISVFFAPMRRKKSAKIVMNGVRITRLKQKLGTKALPTSELEIKGMRAWLVGEEGKGTKEISSILNTTRLWTALGSVGAWARSLAIARGYASIRRVQNKTLLDNLQHVRWMADETVKYRAAAHFGFLGAALNGVVEQGLEAIHNTKAAKFLPSDQAEAEMLLRVLTPVIKAQCSLASVEGLRSQMESLGGVGYCENSEDGGVLNIARLFRDTSVNPIWEGTVSVMAEDFVRAIKGKEQAKVAKAMDSLVHQLLQDPREGLESHAIHVQKLWTKFLQHIAQGDRDHLLYQGRHLLLQVEGIVCACLLISDANADGDEVAFVTATRWVTQRLNYTVSSTEPSLATLHDQDKRIFLGNGKDTTTTAFRAHI